MAPTYRCRWQCLTVILLALGISTAALAACPSIDTSIPAAPEARAARLQQLDALASRCVDNAAWYAQRGALLLAAGQPVQAAESLERALLIDPGLDAVYIDYADALGLLGDYASAREIAQTLVARSDLPATARSHLQAQLAFWQQRSRIWRTYYEYSAMLGWESNLNGGPQTDSIWLTLPAGAIELPLAASTRARSGFAFIYDATAAATHPVADGWNMLLRGQARVRDAEGGASDYLLADVSAGLLRKRHETAYDWQLQIGQRNQFFGGAQLLDERRIDLRYHWVEVPGCQPLVGMDHAWRRFPTSGALDGRQYGMRLGVGCRHGQLRLDADLRLARDDPRDPDRPGAAQRLTELHVEAAWAQGPWTATVTANLGYVRDTTGYSQLLDDGRTRNIARQALRLEMERRLGAGWEAVAAVDSFRQRSNLDLFRLNDIGIYFGARYRH